MCRTDILQVRPELVQGLGISELVDESDLRLDDSLCPAVRAGHLHIDAASGQSEHAYVSFGNGRLAILAAEVRDGRLNDAFEDEVIHRRWS